MVCGSSLPLLEHEIVPFFLRISENISSIPNLAFCINFPSFGILFLRFVLLEGSVAEHDGDKGFIKEENSRRDRS